MPTAPTPATDKALAALYHKLNWRLLPLLFIGYVFAYLDRINVGFAKLQMQNDLGLSDAAYGAGAGIFFIGYVLFELPSTLMLPRIGARKTFSRILVLWGITSACMLFVRDVPTFYAMRFLLGVFEAGFAPGMIYYLSRWYGPNRMARAIAIVFIAGPMGGILGGPISAWLITTFAGVGGLAGWQWMFLIEGLPCVFLGVLMYCVLCDRPADAPWLNAAEKQLLETELGTASARNHSFRTVLRDPKVYVLASAYFCIIFSIYAMSFWLPAVIKALGVNDTQQLGWYAALPYVGAALGMYWIGRRSDRLGERRLHCAIPAATGAVLLILYPLAGGNLLVSMALLSLSISMMFMAYTVLWAMPSEHIKGDAAAGGIALINTIGLSGGFWGPAMIGWAKTATGSLDTGLVAVGCVFLCAAFVIIATKPRTRTGVAGEYVRNH
ncbi:MULTISPECIES: MFS transporter [Pseudomonas]|jgi:sugar phosphate permease|uniref:Major facilitator transporter n=1 Tax=Pseudomonas fluorescens LMG 5329 TaxID=1324332 RepID=A0A0A1YTA4_PSEFL|nr:MULTISPECIES: MFS transporter [Pseudomonas]KGE64101.1 major facilitator transporter [Pseudomonas fluorescens LMG 5329]NWE00668.1 MFS transporter [Pseudomonas sp. IPO3749]NWF24288.1 MFS transporter [Pseudomonas sp. IPO3749]